MKKNKRQGWANSETEDWTAAQYSSTGNQRRGIKGRARWRWRRRARRGREGALHRKEKKEGRVRRQRRRGREILILCQTTAEAGNKTTTTRLAPLSTYSRHDHRSRHIHDTTTSHTPHAQVTVTTTITTTAHQSTRQPASQVIAGGVAMTITTHSPSGDPHTTNRSPCMAYVQRPQRSFSCSFFLLSHSRHHTSAIVKVVPRRWNTRYPFE